MVVLDKLSDNHLMNTFRWINDPHLSKMFLFKRQVTWEDHIRWYQKYLKDESQEVYAISYNSDHVGNIGLKEIDVLDRSAETWIYLGQDVPKRKGIGYGAYLELFRLIRSEGCIDKLCCHIALFNQASISLYKKVGFENVSQIEETKHHVGNGEIVKMEIML